MKISLIVNGTLWQGDVEPRLLLAHLLRERLRLTATRIGCDTSFCGACTVLLDGRTVKSCTVLAVQADGGSVTTAESLAGDPDDPATWHPLARAFRAHHALQCGFCTSGMLVAAAGLLAGDPDPDEDAVRHGLEGNICRCTGYGRIVDAVTGAAAEMRSAP
ncbi:(2Fe-2S)-binding protein [Phytohabitans suffuscus]|uniref:Carbon-monoxide dehydrogenase small subunit n=1 Tax=Phytohabitans suffuscus TaxID=624315 RepID=A0A6F8Z1A4_9ACTN|nr:(2Fe-2S)-binding protein [Phytohabitans suffuscus]BCB91871.1 carbon-monoxide dehydrogenase small subunit [Phytohabitans suffuscus]